uniref:hypothetical protein n=1 Tax=Hafnia alvei TaxID=569 RepID=UPI0024305236|nr:hypothetical protein [Hafnia alvei]
MILILSLLVIVQWLAVYRLNDYLAQKNHSIRELKEDVIKYKEYINRIRRVAQHPTRNAIQGWLNLQSLEQELKNTPKYSEVNIYLWKAMDSLKDIIKVMQKEFPESMLTQFKQVLQKRNNKA